jgi:hypothetical protein
MLLNVGIKTEPWKWKDRSYGYKLTSSFRLCFFNGRLESINSWRSFRAFSLQVGSFFLWARKNVMIEGKNVICLVSTNTDTGYKHEDHYRREMPHFSNSTTQSWVWNKLGSWFTSGQNTWHKIWQQTRWKASYRHARLVVTSRPNKAYNAYNDIYTPLFLCYLTIYCLMHKVIHSLYTILIYMWRRWYKR